MIGNELGGLDLLLRVAIYQLVIVWPTWRVFRRAGLDARWALLVLVPVVGPLLALAVLGHSKWPVVPPKPVRRRRR